MREEDEDKKGVKTNFFDFLERDNRKIDPVAEKYATEAVDAMIEVHRHLGPGHPEKVYENALCIELDFRGIPYERQLPVKLSYKGQSVGESFVDVLIGGILVLELKSVEMLSPTHKAQVNSYLAALKLHLGLLANFNSAMMRDGIKRVIRSYTSS